MLEISTPSTLHGTERIPEVAMRPTSPIVGQKIEEYKISADNIYNMDEKGFLIGKLQKTHRISSRELYERGTLAGTGQDGNREWITVVATICADGTRLSPALIYKAVSGNF